MAPDKVIDDAEASANWPESSNSMALSWHARYNKTGSMQPA